MEIDIKWENLNNSDPPIVPKWTNEYDTSNFCVNKMYDEKEILNPFFHKVQNTNQDVRDNFKILKLKIF